MNDPHLTKEKTESVRESNLQGPLDGHALDPPNPHKE